MNSLSHAIINGLLGFLLQFNFIGILIIVLGGILIDVDHAIYQYFIIKNKKFNKMWKWHIKECKVKSFHFFPFHMLEVSVVISFVFYFINWYLFLFFLGFVLHILTDIVDHLIFHKNLKALKYYTLTGYFISKFIN